MLEEGGGGGLVGLHVIFNKPEDNLVAFVVGYFPCILRNKKRLSIHSISLIGQNRLNSNIFNSGGTKTNFNAQLLLLFL